MDYESFDKQATKWGIASISSKEKPLTLLEVSEIVRFFPVSEADLIWFKNQCEKWEVKTNVDKETFWK